MIDHKLARKLKKVGFPQREDLLIPSDEIEETPIKRDIALGFQRHGNGYHKTFDLSFMGYPKTESDYYEQGKFRCSSIFSKKYLESEEGKEETFYFPVLSELIEACGDRFESLRKGTQWHAMSVNEMGGATDTFIMKSGKTPEEAVAKLYIELNKK